MYLGDHLNIHLPTEKQRTTTKQRRTRTIIHHQHKITVLSIKQQKIDTRTITHIDKYHNKKRGIDYNMDVNQSTQKASIGIHNLLCFESFTTVCAYIPTTSILPKNLAQGTCSNLP